MPFRVHAGGRLFGSGSRMRPLEKCRDRRGLDVSKSGAGHGARRRGAAGALRRRRSGPDGLDGARRDPLDRQGTRRYKTRPNDGRDRWKVSIRPGLLLDAGGGGGYKRFSSVREG